MSDMLSENQLKIETFKKRVNLYGTLTHATINDLVHLIDLVHSDYVEIIIDGSIIWQK